MSTYQANKGLLLAPSLARANRVVGETLLKSGDSKKALPYLKLAAKNDPSDASNWFWLGMAYESEHEAKKAISAYKQVRGNPIVEYDATSRLELIDQD